MLKKIVIAMVGACLLSATVSAQAGTNLNSASTYLNVINTSSATLRIQEGRFVKTDEMLQPGYEINLYMYGGVINNLTMSQKVRNDWEVILGCPRGSFNHTINVRVYRDVSGVIGCIW